jgi:hypothetical protein
MADKKISALTAASTPLAGTEVLPIVQGGATVKATVANIVGAGTSPGSFTSVNASADIVLANTKSLHSDAISSYIVVAGGSTSSQSQGSGVYFYGNTNAGTGSIYMFSGNVAGADIIFAPRDTEKVRISPLGTFTLTSTDLVFGTSGKGITNSTGSVALNFSTAGTALTGGAQSVLTGSFPNVATAQTIPVTDTSGGYIVITAIQPGIGSTTYTIPLVKRSGTVAIGTASKAILTADPILSVAASGGDIVVTPIAGNTYFTYAIYYTPLGA